MKKFALIGSESDISQIRLTVIKDISNNSKLTMDSNDAIGIIDMYLPQEKILIEFFLFFLDEAIKFSRFYFYIYEG